MEDFKKYFNELIAKRFEEESSKPPSESSDASIPEDYYVLNKLIDFREGGYGGNLSYVVADSITWVDPVADEHFGPFPFEWKDIGTAFKGLNPGDNVKIVPKVRVVSTKEEPRNIKIKDIFTTYKEGKFSPGQEPKDLESLEYFMHYSGSGVSFPNTALSVYILCEYESKDLFISIDYNSDFTLVKLFKENKDSIIGKDFNYSFNPCKIVKAKDGFVYEDKFSKERIVATISKTLPKKEPDVKPSIPRRKSR